MIGRKKAAIDFDPESSGRVRQLIEDCIDICLARDRVNWSCERTELIKALRGGRYSFYTLRSNRSWHITQDQEIAVYDLLVNQGFDLRQGRFYVTSKIHKPGHIPFDLPAELRDEIVAANMKIDPDLVDYKGIKRPKTLQKKPKPKTSGLHLIDLPPDNNVEELIELLRDTKDQMMKKRLRAKLRSLGHKGGLRGAE